VHRVTKFSSLPLSLAEYYFAVAGKTCELAKMKAAMAVMHNNLTG